MTALRLIDQTRITHVWHALGGGELRRGRGQAFWRRSDGWSVPLSDEKGCWHDFVTGEGGGVLELIQHVRGGTRSEALRWLADWRGVALDDVLVSPETRRCYARARQAVSVAATDIEYWRDAFAVELNAQKVEALAREDFETLSRAAKLCRVLESGSPEEIASEFIRHRATNPKDTERLMTEGRERDIEAQLITAECVLRLAQAAEQESPNAAA